MLTLSLLLSRGFLSDPLHRLQDLGKVSMVSELHLVMLIENSALARTNHKHTLIERKTDYNFFISVNI